MSATTVTLIIAALGDMTSIVIAWIVHRVHKNTNGRMTRIEGELSRVRKDRDDLREARDLRVGGRRRVDPPPPPKGH